MSGESCLKKCSPSYKEESLDLIGDAETIANVADNPSTSIYLEDEEEPLFVQQYSIVKSILEKLPVKDLLAASQACQEWSEIGQVVRRQRKNHSGVLLYHPYLPHNQETFEYFNGHAVTEPSKEFIRNAQANGFPSYDELVNEQTFPLFNYLRAKILKDFCGAYSEPQMLVVVGTAAIDEYMSTDDDNETKLKIILSGIPKVVSCLVSFSYGIVAAIPCNTGISNSLEIETSELPLLSALAIPKVPGLVVKMFTLTKELNAEFKGKVDKDNCKTILNITEEDNVKGIVLFHTNIRQAAALKDALFIYLKDNPHVALGGGAHYKNLASVCGEKTPIGAGLIICGDENVRVASIGLVESKVSPKNESKLAEMKSCEFKDGNSFAFMFACNGRGAHMHGKTDVESTLFHKYFPKTNLIGTFTGGEYCHEVIPTRNEPPVAPKKHSSLEYAYTTVFVFVSYKWPNNSKA